jgi:hypothetical protein
VWGTAVIVIRIHFTVWAVVVVSVGLWRSSGEVIGEWVRNATITRAMSCHIAMRRAACHVRITPGGLGRTSGEVMIESRVK